MSDDLEKLAAQARADVLRAQKFERLIGQISDLRTSIHNADFATAVTVDQEGRRILLDVSMDWPAAFGEFNGAKSPVEPAEGATGRIDPEDPETVGPETSASADLAAAPPPTTKPKKQAAKMGKPSKNPHGKPVTEAELKQIEVLWAEGLLVAQIGSRLGIKAKRVSNIANRNRDRFPKRSRGGLGEAAKEIVKNPPTVTPPLAVAPTVDTSRFTPEQDLKLVQHMQAGDGIGTAAAIIRIPRDICVARWDQLVPIKTPQHIEALIKRLSGPVGGRPMTAPVENPSGFNAALRAQCAERCALYGEPACWTLPVAIDDCELITPCAACLRGDPKEY